VVEALAAEGIYTHISIVFPLTLRPPAGLDWLPGYDGKRGAVATLFFNPNLQERYRSWWRALLHAKSARTGQRLVDDPALFGAELVNEDSLLFWTFGADSVPEPQLRLFETQFAAWLATRYGSPDQALARWGGPRLPRDRPAENRIGFRGHHDLFTQRTARDQDTVRFLVETQRQFYQRHVAYLHELGFRGVITASNWQTASPERLGPLESYSYTPGDFVDRHGYFSCRNRGPEADWSLRDGQTYLDRSALRFDPEEPGAGPSFVNPALEVGIADKPSMLSETTWNRPNRHRGEAPVFLAAYGALQDTDALVHFAKDGVDWQVKPRFFMQPWTLTSPAMLGQFPAAARLYRQGLVQTGDLVADVTLGLPQLFALSGTPLPQDAAYDEFRRKDLPVGRPLNAESIIDPLVHLVGRTRITFADAGKAPVLAGLDHIDRAHRRVTSSTGQLRLDYGRGLLTIDAPAVQGASGDLGAGAITLSALAIDMPLDVGHVLLVSLDGQPLARARRMLLQVMSEERATGFRSEAGANGERRIVSIGVDPWQVRTLAGTIGLRRADLVAEALDATGVPTGRVQPAARLDLEPSTLYYLIRPR
jgi:hypothetical protein